MAALTEIDSKILSAREFRLESGQTLPVLELAYETYGVRSPQGDNGILDLSKAYRLKVGSGWLIDPCILHAPGSLCTYEPQWGSDVFGMYQNLRFGVL